MSFHKKHILPIQKKEVNHWIILFLMGFTVGVICLHVLNQTWGMQKILVNHELLQRLENVQLDCQAYFQYVLKERVGILVGLFVLATTVLGWIICKGYIIWYGFSLGMMLAALTMEYGIKGIFIYLVYSFPHIFFYVPLLIFYSDWCEQVHAMCYRREQLPSPKLFLGKLFGIMIGLGVTIIMESYLNPIFVQNLVEYL